MRAMAKDELCRAWDVPIILLWFLSDWDGPEATCVCFFLNQKNAILQQNRSPGKD